MWNMKNPHLPYPIIIHYIIASIDIGCVAKILDVFPARKRLATDRVRELCLYFSANHNTGANVVEAAFAIIPRLERAINQFIIRLWNYLAKPSRQERYANFSAVQRAHEWVHEGAGYWKKILRVMPTSLRMSISYGD
jgi:hypothetical protein